MTNDTPHAHRPPTPKPERDDEALVMFLETDQLVSDKTRPVPRAPLSPKADAALWALRLFVLIVSAMVIYTFFTQLGS